MFWRLKKRRLVGLGILCLGCLYIFQAEVEKSWNRRKKVGHLLFIYSSLSSPIHTAKELINTWFWFRNRGKKIFPFKSKTCDNVLFAKRILSFIFLWVLSYIFLCALVCLRIFLKSFIKIFLEIYLSYQAYVNNMKISKIKIIT